VTDGQGNLQPGKVGLSSKASHALNILPQTHQLAKWLALFAEHARHEHALTVLRLGKSIPLCSLSGMPKAGLATAKRPEGYVACMGMLSLLIPFELDLMHAGQTTAE
jgi:hypothetical protein